MSRKRKKMNKKTSLRIHAQKRAIQRYGIFLNSKELKQIVSLIQDNCGIFLEKISNRVTNWKVKYKDRDYIVGYDKLRKSIITFLPQEADMIVAQGIIAKGEANAKAKILETQALYDGASGALRAKVEMSLNNATQLKGMLAGVSVISDKALVSLSSQAQQPKIVVDSNS